MSDVVVKLKDIVDELEMVFDDLSVFLDANTGRIYAIPDEYSDFDPACFEDEEPPENADLRQLPDKYEINEWRIMEDFANEQEEEKIRDSLLHKLHGRKPFRSFKDEAIELGVIEEYYSFRTAALYEIARHWCLEEQLAYTEA